MRFAALALAAALAGCGRPSVAYPCSAQWRGDHFANPAAWEDHHGLFTLFTVFNLDGAKPRGWMPARGETSPVALADETRPFSITWIGHATTLIRLGGAAILTDPVFARRILLHTRRAPPGVPLWALPPIDVVLISHDHRDHLDEETIERLPATQRYVVPLGVGRWLRAHGRANVTELDWWQSTTVPTARGAVRVTMVPARHWSRRGLRDDDQSLWGGYVLDGGGERVYFAGDTGWPAAFDEIGRRFPGIGYALLPIAPSKPRRAVRTVHMSPEDAVRALRELGARRVIPIHWGTFHLGRDRMDEPPRRLRRALGDEAWRLVQLPIGGTTFVELPRVAAENGRRRF